VPLPCQPHGADCRCENPGTTDLNRNDLVTVMTGVAIPLSEPAGHGLELRSPDTSVWTPTTSYGSGSDVCSDLLGPMNVTLGRVTQVNIPHITVDNVDIVDKKKCNAVIAASYAYSTSLHPV
jgi:hypothetical protein